MRNRIGKWTVIPLVLSLSACGTGTLLNNRFSIDETPPSGLVLDASKRVILVTDKSLHNTTEERHVTARRHVVCAEPSPDTFALFAASGGLNLGPTDPNANAYLARSMASIAHRTATTQLLRDGLYRACEAYMNGVIDHEEYRSIVMSYDELLITLVALEGLAGPFPQPAPPGDITSTGSAPDSAGTSGTTTGTTAPKETAKPRDEDALKSPGDDAAKTSNLGKEAVEGIKQVVRDYYCFQLTLKKLFYEKQPRNRDVKTESGNCHGCYGEMDAEVLHAMCRVNNSKLLPSGQSDPPTGNKN